MYYNYQTAKPSKEAFTRTCSVKKVFLKISQTLEENTCTRVSFLIKFSLKKETLVQVVSSEFCQIFKNNFFIEHLRWLLLHI